MEQQPSPSDYRVEVSGWDVAESFFVEKASLELDLEGVRVVQLHHPLRAGSMVFLRLIDTRVSFPAFPVAYQVLDVAASESDGVSRIRLRRLGHRHEKEPDVPPPSEMADAF